VREAAGIAAYHAGEWTEALGELRAARRMGGGPGHLAVMADIERALGRPERAIDLARGPESRELSRAEAIELAIVAAGARRDLGELDAAVVGLQLPELDPAHREPWSARLFYAYADNLAAAGREAEAVQWFVHAADADDTGETDAAARLAQLTGEPLPDDDVEFGEEDLAAGEQPAETEAGRQEPEDDDRADDAVVEQASADETPAGDAEIEPVSDSTEPAALTEPTGPTSSPEDEEASGVDAEAGPAADDDVPSSAADPVVTDPVVTDPGVTDPVVPDSAVVDAGVMSDPRGTDGPAGR
jgi:hypothetical protein